MKQFEGGFGHYVGMAVFAKEKPRVRIKDTIAEIETLINETLNPNGRPRVDPTNR